MFPSKSIHTDGIRAGLLVSYLSRPHINFPIKLIRVFFFSVDFLRLRSSRWDRCYPPPPLSLWRSRPSRVRDVSKPKSLARSLIVQDDERDDDHSFTGED
jgi:hypothetical protein